MHRYVFASPLVKGKRVLDAACGEGYGSALLAGSADFVNGVDIDSATIEYARGRYQADNLSFKRADCRDLPFEDGHFDCVVSFETIEHLEDQSGVMREFRRVLKPEGMLIISSHDKAVYSDAHEFDNEYHVKELYHDEFRELLAEQFPATLLFRQQLLFHSVIWSTEKTGRTAIDQLRQGEVARMDRSDHDGLYLLALCAADTSCLPAMDEALWLFDDAEASVYQHYQHEIRKNMSAGKYIAERDQEILDLKAALAEKSVPWWRRLFRSK